MKMSLSLVLFSLVLVSAAEASSRLPFPPKPLEAVNVKAVELQGDFMPPLPPGAPTLPSAMLTVQVYSGGCTRAEDFVVRATPTMGGKRLAIERKKIDPCDAYLPGGVEVELHVPNVGFSEQLYIANPLMIVNKTTH